MENQLLEKKDLKTLLIKLLESKGLWSHFMNNVWNEKDYDFKINHDNDLNKLFERDADEWVNGAFDWNGSTEGFARWNEINHRWHTILEKNHKFYDETY